MNYRNIWYKKLKRVPRNIILNSTVLLHWYLGDGCLVKQCPNKKTYHYIRLYTNGFLKKDVLFLRKILKEQLNLNFKVMKMKYKNGKICYFLRTKECEKFLKITGDCPKGIVDIYEYKFIL